MPSAGVRPTGDRAKEGLFNSLGSLLDLPGARVPVYEVFAEDAYRMGWFLAGAGAEA